MLYLVGSVVFILCTLLLMFRFDVNDPISKGAGLAIVLGILANISLAENIANNLVPEQNDGYSIRTGIATWILGDDGGTLEGFKEAFTTSIYFTLFLIFLYVIASIVESRFVISKNK